MVYFMYGGWYISNSNQFNFHFTALVFSVYCFIIVSVMISITKKEETNTSLYSNSVIYDDSIDILVKNFYENDDQNKSIETSLDSGV